jgi:hypothetical protein
MRALPNLRSSIVAIAIILALAFVPACGSLCSTMTYCSSSSVSAESDSCHHTDMSAQTDSDAFALSSQALCNQQTPLLAILTASDLSIQLESVNAAKTLLPVAVPAYAANLKNQFHNLVPTKDSHKQSIPLANLSVLRI